MSKPSTYVLTAANNFLAVSGSNNLVFVLGGGTTDIAGDGRELTVDIGARGGDVTITDFKGVVGLNPALGFTSASDALHHVVSDGHGGSLLSYAGGHVDLVGIAPKSLSVGNFHVDNFHFAPFGA